MQKRIESWRALQFDPGLPLRRLKNAGHNVTEPVVMRDFKPLQRARDQPRQGPAAGKNHAEPRAFLICQITNALPRDRFGLFRKVCADQKIKALRRFRASAHFHFAEKRIAERGGRSRRALGFATNFFPRADPAKIDIGKVFSRFFEHDRGVFCQFDRGAQEKPLCAMGSVESGDKHVRKFPDACRLLQTLSISLAVKYKPALSQQFVKTLNHWRKRWQSEFLEFPT